MPRRTTNGTVLGVVLESNVLDGLQPGARLVYLTLLGIVRRPYLDSTPYLVGAVARMAGLPSAQVTNALRKLEAARLFYPSRATAFSEVFYLPYALQHDKGMNVNNGMHRRMVQKRVRSFLDTAPDLCDLFAQDYPEWMATAVTPDDSGRRLTLSRQERSNAVESAAG